MYMYMYMYIMRGKGCKAAQNELTHSVYVLLFGPNMEPLDDAPEL